MTVRQKNFRVDEDWLETFRAFCAQNGYDDVAVFRAAIEAFMDMPHEDRARFFKAVTEAMGAPAEPAKSRGSRLHKEP